MAALEFKLTRMRGDQFNTWGILEETTGTGFKCLTIEEAKKRCLPAGDYPLLLTTDINTMGFGLRVSTFSIYRYAKLTCELGDKPGVIALAQRTKDGETVCSQDALQALSDIIEEKICNGLMPKTVRKGDIPLHIEYAPDYVYEEKVEDIIFRSMDFT